MKSLIKEKNTTSVRHCIDNLIRKKIMFEHKQKVGDGRFRWIQLYILFQLLVLVYARFCRLVLIVPFFLIPYTKPSSSSCCCRSSVIQLFGRESILFFRSRRCRFTQIANGWLPSYRLGTLQWPNCSWKSSNSSSRSAQTALWESHTKPASFNAVTLWSVIVDRLPSIFNLC